MKVNTPSNTQMEKYILNLFLPDMFLIIGRKMNILASSEKRFEPTIHRVAIPSGTQRNSLLLFMDVRQ